jgi:hypothetical protein
MDWMPDRVTFLVDGNIVKNMTENVPTDAGRLFLNHWSNGSPGWSGGPPLADSIVTVLYVKSYFNSSDPGRIAAASQRCAGSSGTVCTIPTDLSLGSGNISTSGALPRPGRVPFLSTDAQNIVGQETYNATYSCDGCPKKSTASGLLRDVHITYKISCAWLLLGIFFLLH